MTAQICVTFFLFQVQVSVAEQFGRERMHGSEGICIFYSAQYDADKPMALVVKMPRQPLNLDNGSGSVELSVELFNSLEHISEVTYSHRCHSSKNLSSCSQYWTKECPIIECWKGRRGLKVEVTSYHLLMVECHWNVWAVASFLFSVLFSSAASQLYFHYRTTTYVEHVHYNSFDNRCYSLNQHAKHYNLGSFIFVMSSTMKNRRHGYVAPCIIFYLS